MISMLSASPISQYQSAASEAVRTRLKQVFDPLTEKLLRDSFEKVSADEGTLWLAHKSKGVLVPVFNSGPGSKEFVAKFRQPLDRGVVSMVFHNEQAFCENEVYKNATHDETIDEALHQVTAAMIAVPFYFAHEPRGVVSCVRLGEGEFTLEHLKAMQFCVMVLERLIDWHLLRGILDEDEF